MKHDKSNPQKEKTVLIMAGGTGGHVFPALACATALQSHGVRVHWLGTRSGLEAHVIPNAGIEISYISIGGLRGKGFLTLLLAPVQLLMAMLQAMWVILRVKPRAVVGMGGFASGPGGLAAWLLRKPLLIHEQNAVPGLTNRILIRLARRAMEAFPGTFPSRYQAVHTGNPLRFDILNLPLAFPRTSRQPLHVLVLGGSQGAAILNKTVPEALRHMRHKIEIWHQTGRNHPETGYREQDTDLKIEAFIGDMASAYIWADLAVCRAGALTASELAQVGLPGILVPYPYATDDHQTQNARFLADAGAAVLVPQEQLNPAGLGALLDELSGDPARLQRMSQAARQCARPYAVQQVARVCLEILGIKN
ncbi:MAG: undecaprenyldiphospho-muramoylpentapeptide beta-N-acetylglucosaminyltransferase [Gammaproteobacteria bacterium]|nr:undecaprenyldiphospho-muramoylpentapeptide beta-N-acetylglucosaminyltransferase [Gammaproteobacteria bacterium]